MSCYHIRAIPFLKLNEAGGYLVALFEIIFFFHEGDLLIWRQEAQNDQGQKCIHLMFTRRNL